MGTEADSPRGRIYQIRHVEEVPHLPAVSVDLYRKVVGDALAKNGQHAALGVAALPWTIDV